MNAIWDLFPAVDRIQKTEREIYATSTAIVDASKGTSQSAQYPVELKSPLGHAQMRKEMTHNPNGNESRYKYCITKYRRRNLVSAL
jgi:hypothetical protein